MKSFFKKTILTLALLSVPVFAFSGSGIIKKFTDPLNLYFGQVIDIDKIGSGDTFRGLDVLLNLVSGTQTSHFRALNVQTVIQDPADHTGTFGADPRGAHIAVVHNSGQNGSEISALQTNAIIGGSGTGSTVTTVSGNRAQLGINAAVGNITNAYAFHALTTNGTNNASKQIGTFYAFYANDNSPQTRIGVGKFYNFYGEGGVTYLGGSFARKSRRVAAATNVDIDDFYIGVTNTALPRTITVETQAINYADGLEFCVKDESGGAAANNITIQGQGGENIDGVATYVINTNYGSICMKSDGTQLFTY